MNTIVCGITMGDPSGVGSELIRKTLGRREILKLARFVIIGDNRFLRMARKGATQNKSVDVIDLGNVSMKKFLYGKAMAEYGRASIEYLDESIRLIRSNKIDCLVTAPVCKESVGLAGYKFSGQTEYIADAFSIKDTVMMLLNKSFRVALVTRHVPLKDVPGLLSVKNVFKTISGTAEGLKRFLAIKNPKIAVCALNPHGSDNGLLGQEEKKILVPAIKLALKSGIRAFGPFPSDTLFYKVSRAGFDCVVCMYHDQGLIPLKLTGFRETVNMTLGLPFVRTSPGHGTAFDIAGKNAADPASFCKAIKLAVKCAQNIKKSSGRTF